MCKPSISITSSGSVYSYSTFESSSLESDSSAQLWNTTNANIIKKWITRNRLQIIFLILLIKTSKATTLTNFIGNLFSFILSYLLCTMHRWQRLLKPWHNRNMLCKYSLNRFLRTLPCVSQTFHVFVIRESVTLSIILTPESYVRHFVSRS